MRNDTDSFRRGWLQVRMMDSEVVKADIMNALGVISEPTWKQRLYGYVQPRKSEAERIVAVFAKYGITDVWGFEKQKVTELETSKTEQK